MYRTLLIIILWCSVRFCERFRFSVDFHNIIVVLSTARTVQRDSIVAIARGEIIRKNKIEFNKRKKKTTKQKLRRSIAPWAGHW